MGFSSFDKIKNAKQTHAANDINIINSTDTYAQSSEQKAKSSGLTVALAGTVGDAVNSIVSTVNQANAAKDRGNDRLNTAYTTKAALTAAQAGQSLYQDFTDTSDANKANQGNFIGVSVSVGASKSQSNSTSTQTVANSSNIAAGNKLTVIATGDGTKGVDGFATDGDVNVVGSNLSGKTVDVIGARDVNFASAANTSVEDSTNKSSSANLGVSLGVSASGSFGLSVFANAAVGKGKAGGNGTTHTETTVTATDKLTIDAGRDLNLTGAQARGNSLDVDVGRNLAITSEQDTNDYKSKQTNASAGVSIPIGVGAASVNLGVNQQKVNSTYASVNEQSGLYAGNGGSNVTVAGHTQLNGGAIASTAPAELNHFSTGTLGFTDIQNHAEYKATSSGINLGTGSLLTNVLKNASAALPAAANQNGNQSSTTQAVISPSTITVGGQVTNPEGLSRDATTANDSLKPIFDLQKVQDDMALGQVVGEIGQLTTQITTTVMEREAYVNNDTALYTSEQSMKANDPAAYAQYVKAPSAGFLLDYEFNQKMLADPAFAQQYGATYTTTPEAERATYVQSLTTQGVTFGGASTAAANLHQTQAQYGVGSPFGRAAQALTGLASGIAGGNVNQGLSAAAAPYLTSAIGKYFDDMEVGPDGKRYPTAQTTAGRLLAHAAAGAAIAYASDNNAGAGAIGAVSGEAMAMIVHQQLYDGKPVSELTQSEKENIRAVATLASGLVGGVAGGNFENAATAANAGFNAAVNNDTRSMGAYATPDQVAQTVQSCVAKGDYDCITRAEREGQFTGNDTYWRTQYNAALSNKRNMDAAIRTLNSCINGGGSAETCAAKMKQNDNGVRTLFTLLPLVGEGEAAKILFAGTDINGEEASRWWGAFGIVTAGYGQKARILGKVEAALKDEVKVSESLASKLDNTVPVHHVCTNKNCLSSANGGPWTPVFQEYFDGAGLDINKAVENLVAVEGHKGPHPQAYHEYVESELFKATRGLAANTEAYKNAVVNTLNSIKVEATTVGSQVNNWLTKR